MMRSPSLVSTKLSQVYCSSSRPLSFATRPVCLIARCRDAATSSSRRPFSASSHRALKEYFPPPRNVPHIKLTKQSWQHPVYTEEQLKDIVVAHRSVKTTSDWIALAAVRVLRWGMDFATGYNHAKELACEKMGRKSWWTMNERSVPGMVGGMLRHLQSLRRMKRDNGWIETLLEEAANERMHLLTFLKLAEPGWFMRFMILGAQGVFFNGMFLAYLVSPRTCHRFVGYLEEEACITYSRAIADIEQGKLPRWADPAFQAPAIAVSYWNMPDGKRTMKDLLMYIRADEAKHREVNHTMANLDQNNDPNPFVSEYTNPELPHPTKGLENIRPTGWERQEVI